MHFQETRLLAIVLLPTVLHPQTGPSGLDSYCKVLTTSQVLCEIRTIWLSTEFSLLRAVQPVRCTSEVVVFAVSWGSFPATVFSICVPEPAKELHKMRGECRAPALRVCRNVV